MKIEQDPNQKDRVLLDIHIITVFPGKSFVIQLAGHKGDNPEDAIWGKRISSRIVLNNFKFTDGHNYAHL